MNDYKGTLGENQLGNIDTEQMLMNQFIGANELNANNVGFNEQDSNYNALSSFNNPSHFRGQKSVLYNITARDEDIMKNPNKVNISEKHRINQGINFNRGFVDTFSMGSYSPPSSANDATLNPNPNKNFDNSQGLDLLHKPLIFPIGDSLGNLTEMKIPNESGNVRRTNNQRRERLNKFVTTEESKISNDTLQNFLNLDEQKSRGNDKDPSIP